MKPRRNLGLLLLAGLLAVLVAGCVGRISPRGWAGPVTSGGSLLIATGSTRLDGIDASGQRIWRFPELWNVGDKNAEKLRGIYGPPVLSSDGKVVFVGDYNGYVYAFRPGDFVEGQTETQPPATVVKLGDPIIGGLALDPTTGLLFATSGNRVYSMSAAQLVDRIDKKGDPPKLAVLFEAGDEIWGRPVVGGGRVLFSSLDGNLYAVDPITGELKWSFKSDKGLVSTPTVADNLVFVSGFGSTLYAVNLNDGSEQWSFKANHWIWGRPAMAQGTLYTADFDGIVHALDASSGQESWSVSLDKGAISASPAIAGNTLILSTNDGWLAGVDLGSHEVVWQRDIGTALNSDITVDAGRVYIEPKGCVTPEGGGDKVYYIEVDPTNGDLTAASGVC